jgi:hypothetical protein
VLDSGEVVPVLDSSKVVPRKVSVPTPCSCLLDRVPATKSERLRPFQEGHLDYCAGNLRQTFVSKNLLT